MNELIQDNSVINDSTFNAVQTSFKEDPWYPLYFQNELMLVKDLLQQYTSIDTTMYQHYFVCNNALFIICPNNLQEKFLQQFHADSMTEFPIFVTLSHGKTIVLQISENQSIDGLKLKIQHSLKIPKSLQSLSFAGKLLENNNATVSDYSIQKYSTIQLTLPLQGGMIQNSSTNPHKNTASTGMPNAVNWKKSVPVHVHYAQGMTTTNQFPHLLTVENIDEVTKHIVHLVVHGSKEAVEEATHSSAAHVGGTTEPKLTFPKKPTRAFGCFKNCIIL